MDSKWNPYRDLPLDHRFPVGLHHQPQPAELGHVLAEDRARGVVDVVVERVVPVRDLELAVLAPGHAQQALVDALAGTRPSLGGHRRPGAGAGAVALAAVSYTHLRAHETVLDLVCRLLLE